MFDTELKHIIEKYKIMLAKAIPPSITANHISIFGMVINLIGCALFAFNFKTTSFFVLVTSFILDGIDGILPFNHFRGNCPAQRRMLRFRRLPRHGH